jgi:four helix bundle protein
VLAPSARWRQPARSWREPWRPTAVEPVSGEAGVSICGKTDDLRGIKENVIMGRVLPAGTGLPAHKRSLADQIMRSSSSIALNVGEAELNDPGNRRARFFTAAGSAGETYTAVRVAIAWRYFTAKEGEAPRLRPKVALSRGTRIAKAIPSLGGSLPTGCVRLSTSRPGQGQRPTLR